MEFDCKKVLTPFTEDKDEWIGWKGFFSDSAINIRIRVEESEMTDDRFIEICDIESYPFKSDKGEHYCFFYPVEPPEEKTIRPYKDIRELAKKAFGYDYPKYEEYEIATHITDKTVRKKNNRVYLRIDACDMEGNRLMIQLFWHSLESFCREFVWEDGSPCGVEEE